MGADVAADESGSEPNGEGSGTAAHDERLAPARRRPWLGIACATLLVLAGVAWWVHAENPFYPYRDGTTHAATLAQSQSCPAEWGVALGENGHGYAWQAISAVPEAWAPGPIRGRVHIIHQRSGSLGDRSPSATFQARGITVDLFGGRQPVFFYATCAIR